MKLKSNQPPREFAIGRGQPIVMKDCARIELEPDEQVTFTTAAGAEYDVARKAWGFYATPSLNGRLLNFGLRAALVKSPLGKYYVLLMERGHEDQFERYLDLEGNVVVRWLDDDADLAAIEGAPGSVTLAKMPLHCPCGADRFTTVHTYFAPPAGETRFPWASPYRRELVRCSVCGHFLSFHQMDDRTLYDGSYVNATYGGDDGLRATFERITRLDPAQSDNVGRVARVRAFAEQHFGVRPRGPSILDVGSGLCVFLHRMRALGWDCTALDPDPRAARHARETVGVRAVCADFMGAEPLDLGRFDVLSFNKVLEHVRDPIAMLRRSARHLAAGGFVYIELPDGEMAIGDPIGPAREEFFIEHHHVFSAASLALLSARAGFRLAALERLQEPSTKYTLRAFLLGG